MDIPKKTKPAFKHIIGGPFAKERAIASRIELLPVLPKVEILIASEQTMAYLPAKAWLDSGLQGAFAISPAHYVALGSPKPTGRVKSVVSDGRTVCHDFIKVDLIFGDLKFLNATAAINPALTDTSLMGWAVLKHCHYGYLNGIPDLFFNRPQTFIFPDEPEAG